MTRRTNPFEFVLRLFQRFFQANRDFEGADWQDGCSCTSESCVLTVDGLGSASREYRGRLPWLDIIRAAIDHQPSRQLHGLSYFRVCAHYEPPSTDVSVLSESLLLVEDYLKPGLPVPSDCVGFSLGGLVLVQGVRQILQRDSELSIGRLIIVQPPLAIGEGFLRAAGARQTRGAYIPTIFAETIVYGGDVMRQTFLAGVDELRTRGVPVILLYWPEDEFTPYDPSLQKILDGATTAQLVPECSPEGMDAFQRHCNVYKDPSILTRLLSLL